MNFANLRLLSLLLLAATACAGCSRSGHELQSQREQLLLTSEPDDAESVLDVRETMDQQAPVVVVGRIGGGSDPWTAGTASFVLADPAHLAMQEAEHEKNCDCAFCKHKEQDNSQALALVQFQDKHGKPLRIDARKLFSISEKQTVVVRGKAHIDELGYMIIAADGMYIRR